MLLSNKLANKFDCIIGQSDHTNDIDVPLFAVAAGAQVIEKHYKIDDKMDCIDSPVSITEVQMKTLINQIRRLELILGIEDFGVRESEKPILEFRRFSTLT